jgi:hypothetical protein
MKELLAGITVAVFFFTVPAFADKSECSTIRDHDERMMCFALADRSSTWCEFIKDHDARVMCRARLGK